MRTLLEEQETVIRFDRNSDKATVYTSDYTEMTKLHKLIRKTDSEWKLLHTDTQDGDIVGETYECPKKLISLRSKSTGRSMSEEQRKTASENLKKARLAQHKMSE